MAYKRPLPQRQCDWPICGRPATHEVFNRQNAFVGDYCAKHAEKRVEELNKKEQAQ